VRYAFRCFRCFGLHAAGVEAAGPETRFPRRYHRRQRPFSVTIPPSDSGLSEICVHPPHPCLSVFFPEPTACPRSNPQVRTNVRTNTPKIYPKYGCANALARGMYMGDKIQSLVDSEDGTPAAALRSAAEVYKRPNSRPTEGSAERFTVHCEEMQERNGFTLKYARPVRIPFASDQCRQDTVPN
jgi:hypothetical protein